MKFFILLSFSIGDLYSEPFVKRRSGEDYYYYYTFIKTSIYKIHTSISSRHQKEILQIGGLRKFFEFLEII